MPTNPLEPTANEQYMLELVNRARMNPEAEVQRNPKVASLNEDLTAGTISSTPKQPLAFNFKLIDSARQHSQWMLTNDVFSHTGSGGSSPGDRMAAAGYSFTGSWTWGENIAWNGTTGTPNVTAMVAQQHEGLFDSAGHRVNIMNDAFKEIGIGALTGQFNGYNSVMTTQNFAKSGTSTFLTGVAFDDKVSNDDFYTVGEGLGGITVTVRRQSDNAVFTTTTFGSGGYQLALNPATYQVTFSGGSLSQSVNKTVTVGSQNVKLDLATDQLGSSPSPSPSPAPAGTVVKGTSGDDTITTRSGVQTIYGYAGNDQIEAGDGNDVVYGHNGDDMIRGGGRGNDRLYGGDGSDRVYAGDGSDKLSGNAGKDVLIGVNTKSAAPGRQEIDHLTGGSGGDRFQLGDANHTYYNDGNNSLKGLSDYALIKDFRRAEGDVIQLRGQANNYVLGNASADLPSGTAIFRKTAGANELIGVVQDVNNLSLTSGAFSYV